MDREKLISKLNWFFNLELNQVDLYTSQSKHSHDPYVKIAFERIAYIEQQHVDNIADKIKELGGKPGKIGWHRYWAVLPAQFCLQLGFPTCSGQIS